MSKYVYELCQNYILSFFFFTYLGQEKTSSVDDSSQQVSSKQVKKVKEQKTDANVVLISLRNLENEPNLITGDPIMCIQCRAVVTSTARLEFNGGRASWTWY